MHRNSDRGFVCENIKEDFHVNYTIVFSHHADECYHCIKFLVRTVNVLEKIESKFNYFLVIDLGVVLIHVAY